MTVADCWEKTYLPFAQENLRHSTVHGYRQVWAQRLKPTLGQMHLKEYKTPMGSIFLTGWAKTPGRHTVQHIRSLASSIFAHAVNLGHIEFNPWHDVKIVGKTIALEKPHTTRLKKWKTSSVYQLIVALAFFLGLRPGEIQGLRWEDFAVTALLHSHPACSGPQCRQ